MLTSDYDVRLAIANPPHITDTLSVSIDKNNRLNENYSSNINHFFFNILRE